MSSNSYFGRSVTVLALGIALAVGASPSQAKDQRVRDGQVHAVSVAQSEPLAPWNRSAPPSDLSWFAVEAAGPVVSVSCAGSSASGWAYYSNGTGSFAQTGIFTALDVPFSTACTNGQEPATVLAGTGWTTGNVYPRSADNNVGGLDIRGIVVPTFGYPQSVGRPVLGQWLAVVGRLPNGAPTLQAGTVTVASGYFLVLSNPVLATDIGAPVLDNLGRLVGQVGLRTDTGQPIVVGTPAYCDSCTTDPWVSGDTPGPVQSVRAIPGNGTMRVSWSPPTSPGGSSVMRYVVRLTPGGQTCERNAPTRSNYCTVKNLDPRVKYTASVQAWNSVGPGQVVTGVPTPDTTGVPGAPQDLSLTVKRGVLRLTWSPPRNARSAGLRHYEIRVMYKPKRDGGKRDQLMKTTQTGRVFTYRFDRPGFYFMSVQSVGANGLGGRSVEGKTVR